MDFWREEAEEILRKHAEEASKTCPRCKNRALQSRGDPFTARCAWRRCRKTFNVLKNTPLFSARVRRETILEIIRIWCAKGKAALIAELTGTSAQTVSRVINKMQKRLKDAYNSIPKTIGGPGIIVEIDESKFGKVKYHRGHRVEGVWVFGMVERTPERRIIMVQVENRKKTTLEALIAKYVHPQSTIHSDCWRAYDKLCEIVENHRTVNHSECFVDPVTSVHTNTIEGNWSGVKNQVSSALRTKKYIDYYLIRYALRRNFGSRTFFKVIKLIL